MRNSILPDFHGAGMRPYTIAQWQNRAVGIYLSLQGIYKSTVRHTSSNSKFMIG